MWDECIREANQAVAETYLLANYYAVRQLDNGRPLCGIDDTFYQLCLSLVTSEPRQVKYEKYLSKQAIKDRRARWEDGGKVGKLKDFPEVVLGYTKADYQEWLIKQKVKNADLENAIDESVRMRKGRPQANSKHLNQGWFKAAAKQMITNAKNSVVLNFAKRLRTHAVESVPVRVADPITLELRTKIPRWKGGKISWTPYDLLSMFYEFLQFIEEFNRNNEGKSDYIQKQSQLSEKLAVTHKVCPEAPVVF
ncbi:uncharacterized protein IUM83_05909 [Phytophthora cinnamomi]|uniref:uncharacterized protein n=1 Tax=Phytophthora cinnamomi TaxID=4785 RepID=UPI00355955CA|nr:hypothetical protein IUM83_05909 [Phytophthora cinnamomi]